MLVANIETEVREILEKKGRSGWLRVGECAKEYGRDPITGKTNKSRETKFYRWRKKVEKSQVKGFQVLNLPGNISFIGLESADPRAINSFISKDKRILRSVRSGFGFFEWLDRRAERKEREILELRARIAARMEIIESGEQFTHGKFEEALHKHRRKYGLE